MFLILSEFSAIVLITYRKRIDVIMRKILRKRGSIDLTPAGNGRKLLPLKGRDGLGDIFQLTDVARPAVVGQQFDGIVGQRHLAHIVFLREV